MNSELIMNFISTSYLIVLLPLIGAAVNGFISFAGLKVPKRFVHFVACGAIFGAFVVSCGVFYNLFGMSPDARAVTVTWFEWINLTVLKVNAAFLIDPLSAVMCLVVTGVGFLIHVYSIGYMKHDPGYARFFSYFNLFCFAMLVLVLADNLLLMFVGWEGVGLCSYLLIGFWFDHKPNAVAGMKAFIVNRIGDFGFLLGMLVLFWGLYSVGYPTLEFAQMKANIGLIGTVSVGAIPLATLAALLLFIGASGKSAQIPLYVWLPDAMAGPTPVSALIHAATMVTAGVYMIGRMNFLYSMSPEALLIVATVGTVTAVFSATIGFAQNDIKKVLAYSTVSQLGYMFLGMGTGMYASGIFHLVTHAFFKACLFLGAGSVILGMHHEQDIRKMGGLKKYMPLTYVTFLAATLALAGIFPLSGFFSKDEILWQAFSRGGLARWYYVLWGAGLAGALCTAFYMMRLVSLTFYGKLRTTWDHAQKEEDTLDEEHLDENLHQPSVPYESPRVITGVLVVLAILSAAGGFLGVPGAIGKFIGVPNFIEEWLAPVWGAHEEVSHHAPLEYALMAVSVCVAVFGIVCATWLYTRRIELVEAFTARFRRLYDVVLDKYYVDEIYDRIVVRPLLSFNQILRRFDEFVIDGLVNLTGAAGVLWSKVSGWFDWTFVDGAVNAVSNATIIAGRNLRRVQTGRIQHYFYIIIVGLVVILIYTWI